MINEWSDAREAQADAEPEPVYPEFRIVDEDTAGWVVGKLLAFDEEHARVKAQAARMLASIEADRARFRERFEVELADWLASNLKGKKRSVDLLQGRVGMRRTAGGFRIRDAAACLEWAASSTSGLGLVREETREVLDRDAVRAYFDNVGEVPAGCELVDDVDRLYVRGPK